MDISKTVSFIEAVGYIDKARQERGTETMPVSSHLIYNDAVLYQSVEEMHMPQLYELLRNASGITFWHYNYNPICSRELTVRYGDTSFTVRVDSEFTKVNPDTESLASV